ncbi:MAG: hypothetical protein RR709_07460 [Ruthenibacterium sp.]
MSQFTPIAQSRARYYCKGSPVQFVQVELLRMEDTGSVVVTLTFKNVHNRTLTAFTAHFRCKNAQGAILMEDDFLYDALSVGEGQSFGADDAVFVSDEPLGSVEVNLVSVEYDGDKTHSLLQCPPVPLAQQQQLPAAITARVNTALQFDSAHFLPSNEPDGWQCTCGAFNYNAGRGAVVCSECGAEKNTLFAAIRAAAKAAAAAKSVQTQETFLPVTPPEQGSRVAPETNPYQQIVRNTAQTDFAPRQSRTDTNAQSFAGDAAVMRPETANFILRYAPILTVGASILYVAAVLWLHTWIG